MSFVSDLLHNPQYAGAYVYGRRPTNVAVNDGNFASEESVLGVRRGHGLLVGLLRCARCGRKLHIRYWGKHGTAARYLCAGDFDRGGHYCLGFGGATVDRRMSEQLLEVLSPHGVEASLAALKKLADEDDDRRDALKRQLQQARYEAERALAQYDEADPRNRLVADVLQQRLNDKLKEQQRLEAQLAGLSASSRRLTSAIEASVCALGRDFAAVWNDPDCPMALKKRIARTGLALVPLALSLGQPGSEIQAPMAIVILFGLLTSTALNMIVLPSLYLRFGSAVSALPPGRRS